MVGLGRHRCQRQAPLIQPRLTSTAIAKANQALHRRRQLRRLPAHNEALEAAPLGLGELPGQREARWASTQQERPQRHRRQRHPQLHLLVVAGLACTGDQQAQEEEGEGVVVEQQRYVERVEVEGGRKAAVAGV